MRGAAFLLVALVVGCGPRAEDPKARKMVAEAMAREETVRGAEAAIRSQYAKGRKAVLADKFDDFKAILDSVARNDGAKCGLSWAGIRILVGVGGLKEEDFRIDAFTFNDPVTMAMVTTSHREKGEWKKDTRPQVWTLEDGQWRWML